MARTTLALLALVAAALSAGFALCMSIVHYSTWAFVPSSAFREFQDASAMRTVPTALALGIPSMALATVAAYRGVPGVTRWLLCAAAVLAVIPWVATPTVMIPLQFQLTAEGPAVGLVRELVRKDLVLRTLPPILQTGLLFVAVARCDHRCSSASGA